MQNSTLEFLDNYLSEEQKEFLKDDVNKIRERMSKKTDEQRFEGAIENYKNPRLSLLQAVQKAEKQPTHENIKNVIHCAVKQDDFVTAVYWHERKLSGKHIKLSDKFERYYYSIMAERQKQFTPKAEPCTSVKQIYQNESDTSHNLRDPQYLEHCINYRIQQVETYQKEFDAAENTVFLSAKKKEERSTNLQIWIALLLLVAGGIFLWNTFGAVWSWSYNFFLHKFFLLFIVFWLPPILYAGLVVVLLFALFGFLTGGIGTKNQNKLKTEIKTIERRIEKSLSNSEALAALQSMNENMPTKFQNYDARLVLATISAMTGERNVSKLCDLADNDNTWLTHHLSCKAATHDKKIKSLIHKDAPDSDLFLAYTLFRKHTPADGWYEDDFISQFLKFRLKGDIVLDNKNEIILLNMVERFLLDEALMSEKSHDIKRLGDAYSELYGIFAIANGLMSDTLRYRKAYQYGIEALKYDVDFKYRILFNHGYRSEYDEDYNPYLSLGFTRKDAQEYASDLAIAGDPRGKKLCEKIADADRRIQQRAIQEERDRAKAFWESKAQLMREAEEVREKARTNLNARLDNIEREANLFLHGDFSTQKERALRGEESEMDRIRHQNLRDTIIHEKLNNM